MGKTFEWRPEQQKCIRARGGTLLVSAAAGSGKTAVLIERIIGRITDKTDPVAVNELLVVTFTNAAAAEMKKRLSKGLSKYIGGHPEAAALRRQQLLLPTADVCTMDAFCQRLVRDNALTLNVPTDFKIADEAKIAFLRSDAREEAITAAFEERDNRDFLLLYDTVGAHGLSDTISKMHTFLFEMVDPDRYIRDYQERLAKGMPMEDSLAAEIGPLPEEDRKNTVAIVSALFALVLDYHQRLLDKKAEAGILEFSDVLHYALQLLAARDERGFLRDEQGRFLQSKFAADYCRRFKEIYVDEYQDTNELQNALYSLLSQQEQNLFFVGDAKQSIYGFRGTSPKAFLERRSAYTLSDESEEDVSVFPATVALDCNFRSRKPVVSAVNYFFDQLMLPECGDILYQGQEDLVFGAKYEEGSNDRFHPTLLLVDGVNYSSANLLELEAAAIAAEINKLMNDPAVLVTDGDTMRRAEYRDFCILLRSMKSSTSGPNRDAVYAKVLQQHGIPAATGSGQSTLFDETEIRWVLSLLRCIDNPLLDVPMLSVLMSPVYGFSPDDMAAIRRIEPYAPLFTALKRTAETEQKPASRCKAFLEQLDTWRTLAATVPADRLLWDIYERTKLPDFCAIRENGGAREQNLRLLLDHARSFEQNHFRGLSAFLHFIDRLQEKGLNMPTANTAGSDRAVRIMSIHKSKGLEYPFVFVAHLDKKMNCPDADKRVLFHERFGIAPQWLQRDNMTKHTTPLHEYIKAQITRDAKSEEMRLLYVAMTRAREKLYLVGAFKNLNKKLTNLAKEIDTLPTAAVPNCISYGEWILRAMLRHPRAAALRERAGVPSLSVIEDDTPFDLLFPLPGLGESAATAAPAWTPATASHNAELEALLAERFSYEYPHKLLSSVPSKLAASAVVHAAKTHEYAATAVPSFLKKEGLTAAEKGTATHAFMQFADWSKAAADVAAECERLVAANKLTAEQARSLDRDAVAAFFAHPLYARITAADRVWRELPFTYALSVGDYKKLANLTLATSAEDDEAETLLVQGISDCVFEEQGRLVILDYKTDRGKTMEQLRDHYAPQLKIYAKALSATLGKPVSSCLLYSFTNREIIETETEL